MAERDFPPGHPASADYNPNSPAAKAWTTQNVHPLGERDFPVGNIKACDTPGNLNGETWEPGVDPRNPDLEPHTGATPAQVAAKQELSQQASQTAAPSPVLPKIDYQKLYAAVAAEREKLGVTHLTDEQYSTVLQSVMAAAAA